MLTRTKTTTLFFVCLISYFFLLCCHAFILPPSSHVVCTELGRTKSDLKSSHLGGSGNSINTMGLAMKTTIKSYEEAISIIDQCSVSASPSPSDDSEDNELLYNAVRYIDKNANNLIYPTIDSKEKMWEKAYGSWRLVLATGGGKFTTFKPVPIFAYARIDESSFGNGVGLNENMIILSLLGPHFFETKRRQMKICIDDIFLCANNVSNMMPDFITKNINLKKRPEDFSGKKGDRIPAFTFIASSDVSLVARGGTGGIAIWTRLDKDIKTAAYGR